MRAEFWKVNFEGHYKLAIVNYEALILASCLVHERALTVIRDTCFSGMLKIVGPPAAAGGASRRAISPNTKLSTNSMAFRDILVIDNGA